MKTLTRTLASLILMLLLSACAPITPTAAPTLPPSTPTPTAAPTLTPQPTPTTIPPYQGPLTSEQRAVLLEIANKYISETPEQTKATAFQMGFLEEYSTPYMMCGPLSLAILQGAGLVDPDIPLIDFWYLNPRPGFEEFRIKKAFPDSRFEKIEMTTSINQVDYTKNPLYAGDFLYLFAGDSGSFEHMLVVSRVDESGRAFAVTNLNTTEGVVIREVMLYDPNEPGKGQFYEWTNRANDALGRTGYGGYWLWRLKAPLP